MSGPRNLLGHERGQAHREQIKAVMLDHVRRHPLAKPLSAKQLQDRLPALGLGLSTIAWHVAEIRRQANAETDTLESFQFIR